MPWVTRGLREGIVTTRYPRLPDGYGPSFEGHVECEPGATGTEVAAAAAACPTEAIELAADGARLDRGRCVLCGRCCELAPRWFRFESGFETATLNREALVVPEREADDEDIARTRAQLSRRVKALRRSVHLRHVDAGSDGAEEWEITALIGPIYDVQRLGIFFTASPRHADVLLVTGVGTAGMVAPLRQTYDAMPNPKVVIAVGTDAVSGGLTGGTYSSGKGVASLVPVDVFVPGSPPSPFGILYGILLAVGLVAQGPRERAPKQVKKDETLKWEEVSP
jgi:Ni,Fe-hydrogenase III small subunit/ferredoxin